MDALLQIQYLIQYNEERLCGGLPSSSCLSIFPLAMQSFITRCAIFYNLNVQNLSMIIS